MRVVIAGWVPVSMAYCSAGSPKASQPIGCSTLWPRILCRERSAVRRLSVSAGGGSAPGRLKLAGHRWTRLVAGEDVSRCVAFGVADVQAGAAAGTDAGEALRLWAWSAFATMVQALSTLTRLGYGNMSSA